MKLNKIKNDEKHYTHNNNKIHNLGISQDHFEVKHEIEKRKNDDDDDDDNNQPNDNTQNVQEYQNILKRSLSQILPPTIMMTLKVTNNDKNFLQP